MRRTRLTLYGPLLAIALVQVLIVGIAPSRPPSSLTAAPGVGSAPTTNWEGPAPVGEPAPATTPVHAGGDTPDVPATPRPTATSPGSSPDEPSSPATASPTQGATPTPSSSPAPVGGDTSHCTFDGRQHDVVYMAPPCVPAWPDDADNGGATAAGVTPDTVTVLLFREKKNEQVTALLNQLDLRATRAEDAAFLEVGEAYLNQFYEFYGRNVDLVMFDANSCPESPPDIPACKAEVQRAIREHAPFAVVWPTAIYPSIFDEFARSGVIALGGWNFHEESFTSLRPYRWDLFMDGTRTSQMVGEYYCKKMANDTASHAGRVIHPSFPSGGARDLNERRVGIITQETPAHLPNAELLRSIIAGCDRHEPVVISYQPDIERAQQQASTSVRALIDAQVTTLICLCDPVMPIFAGQAASSANYFPENLLSGGGLLDYDKLGRLYDRRQQAHAFGPSHLYTFPPFAQTDAFKMARAMDQERVACRACNTNAAYINLLGMMIQVAGPDLTPANVEAGMLNAGDRGGWESTGGNPHEVLARFGPGDHTLLSDARDVYWSDTAVSSLDGQMGSYVALEGGRRWTLGQWATGLAIPVPSQ